MMWLCHCVLHLDISLWERRILFPLIGRVMGWDRVVIRTVSLCR